MEARWPVQILAYVGTTEDAFGNQTPSYAAPVTRYVYAWAPGGSVEVGSWRHTVTADIALYAPPDFVVTSRDRVVVDSRTYDVEGVPEDYNHGLSSWTPGFVVNLKLRGA